MKGKLLLKLIIILAINSCSYPEIVRDELIFDNDFEGSDLTSIDGGALTTFNNTRVLGNYNNDGFNLHLNDIGDHDYIFISFDLYIQGSWDGNLNGFAENDKADKWIIELRPDMDLHKDPLFNKFETTFSNSPCYSNYCLRQSYPESYPFENIPKTGVYEVDLLPICQNSLFGGESSFYKIEKGFNHSGNALVIRFYDELYQPNAIDINGNSQQKRDESWALDNLKVRVISYK